LIASRFSFIPVVVILINVIAFLVEEKVAAYGRKRCKIQSI